MIPDDCLCVERCRLCDHIVREYVAFVDADAGVDVVLELLHVDVDDADVHVYVHVNCELVSFLKEHQRMVDQVVDVHLGRTVNLGSWVQRGIEAPVRVHNMMVEANDKQRHDTEHDMAQAVHDKRLVGRNMELLGQSVNSQPEIDLILCFSYLIYDRKSVE